MTYRKAEVAVIGGGAAGIAAARHLHEAGIDCLLIEARHRLGGRAMTVAANGFHVDLGCGWFHSADRNPWVKIAQAQGATIDKSRPPWDRPANPAGFPLAEQSAFQAALNAFYGRAESAKLGDTDVALAHFFEPGNRWNPLIDAISTYYSGAEAARVSARDMQLYDDGHLNWRAEAGYGAIVEKHAQGLNVALDCTVQSIDHGGNILRIVTSMGEIEAASAIVTLPTAVIARQPDLFDPPLPDKVEAAAGLPLGLADKLFLLLERADEFDKDSRIFGHTDRTGTGIYQMRPFGRPLIECYFGGECAEGLEAGGVAAFFDFAKDELAALLGHNFGRRIKPLAMHLWHNDPLAGGSYSYAKPGKVDCRAALAAPVDGRLFFAGEACSQNSFSTAHGAFLSGIAAAEGVIVARAKQ